VNNKPLWVNRGVNTAPISGQASPYTLYQYDANGRMSRRERKYALGGTIQTYDFFWDGDDRLRQVKQGAASRFSATYDGDGLRVTKTDLFSATYTYSRGPGGVLYDGATTYTPGLGQRYNGINPRFVHSDWVGSTRYLSDSSGNFFPSALRYDAFGQRTALAGPNQPTPFQFAGGWGYEAEYSDSTEPYLGLSYLEQRYYEPATGRFISRDPIGFDGGLNLYAYCDNDPVNMVDPDGLGGVWIGGVHLGDDHPWLVFDAPGLVAGLGTGLAAVGSAGTFGLWDGGCNKDAPGFRESGFLAGVGREAALMAATAGASRLAIGRYAFRYLRPIARGRVIERLLGAQRALAPSFPVIDRFSRGVATSIKSLDLLAKTYQRIANLTRVVRGYIDALATFQGAARGGVTITGNMIKARELILALPRGATAEQLSALKELGRYAAQRGVKLIIKWF
jgi:RHS repeat-associated protein